jgi:plastocyanin
MFPPSGSRPGDPLAWGVTMKCFRTHHRRFSGVLPGRSRGSRLTVFSLVATFGLLVGMTPAGAGPDHEAPTSVSVNITGADRFVHAGLITNDYSFPTAPIRVAQGGTITFNNKTSDGHTIALIQGKDLPKTTAQVFNCDICNTVNGAFFTDPNSQQPSVAQLDGGVADDETTADADTIDTGAINSAGGSLPPGFGPVLVADFDKPSVGATVGDATIVGSSGQGPTQRTIVMTGAPGVYTFICTFHPWMQGTIRVVG